METGEHLAAINVMAAKIEHLELETTSRAAEVSKLKIEVEGLQRSLNFARLEARDQKSRAAAYADMFETLVEKMADR